MTEKINRHRSSFDVTIKPCRDLLFRVIASEDWQGTRQDYRVGSENVNFRVDYAPKVKSHFAMCIVQYPSQSQLCLVIHRSIDYYLFDLWTDLNK